MELIQISVDLRTTIRAIPCAIVTYDGYRGVAVQIPERHPFRHRYSGLLLEGHRLATEGCVLALSVRGWWMVFECDSEATDEALTKLLYEMVWRVRHPYLTMLRRGFQRFKRKFIST